MRNDLSALPWADGQYFEVENYLEAEGLMCAMRAGIDPATVRRPLASTIVERDTEADEHVIVLPDIANLDTKRATIQPQTQQNWMVSGSVTY